VTENGDRKCNCGDVTIVALTARYNKIIVPVVETIEVRTDKEHTAHSHESKFKTKIPFCYFARSMNFYRQFLFCLKIPFRENSSVSSSLSNTLGILSPPNYYCTLLDGEVLSHVPKHCRRERCHDVVAIMEPS
jgi:hypothetical protein